VSVVRLERDAPIVLGRSPACDVVIDDATVSRKHAVLRWGSEPCVEDLGSQNGVFVQKRRLAPGERLVIAPGTPVQLGAALVIVQATSEIRLRSRRPLARLDSNKEAFKALDPVMLRLCAMLDVVAPSELAVLLQGETGVGKDVFATEVHARSLRKTGPFVAVNCGAIPAALMEAELFGHAKGAFTDATDARVGVFEAADTGTLFLDEIGELPLAMQPKLLRALETGEIRRVGSSKTSRVDVRIICATNRDLAALVDSGAFRSDLFFRLNGVTIHIPPLRDRPDDIVALAEHFLKVAAERQGRAPVELSAEAVRVLQAHDWPGNVRELRTMLERTLILNPGQLLEPRHLAVGADRFPTIRAPALRLSSSSTPDAAPGGLRERIESFERAQVLNALQATDGNQTRAAKLLGVARGTLINKIEAYELDRPRKRTRQASGEQDD
jgi:transcriptional regulator with GAF, ATPase, and Fis domain